MKSGKINKDNSPSNHTNQWQDIPNDGTLNNFVKLNSLSSNSLKLSEKETILLPNNRILTQLSEDKHLFAPITKDVIIALRDGGISARLYDDDNERRELILESADVIFPILFFLGNSATSVALSILASFIYDRWIRDAVKKPPTIKAEYAEINQARNIVRWRKIEGPAIEIRSLLLEESRTLARQDAINGAELFTQTRDTEPKEGCWVIQCNERASIAIESARNLVQEAKDAIKKNKREVAETLFRGSLVKIREALLWDPEEAYSRYLHDVGCSIHDIFGCQLKVKDGNYGITCPVMLSHNKWGFSIGGSGKSICSICGKDVFDCSHVKGHIYDNVKARRHYDICNICGEGDCGHKEGEKYNGVRAFAIIVEMNLDHISLVPNPANPLCVIQSYSVSKSELLEMLPEDEREQFVYGETVIHCHHCLMCKGEPERGFAPLL